MASPLLRPMRVDDVDEAQRLSAESFHAVDVRTRPHGTPEPAPRSSARAASWRARTASLLRTDPGGSWVVEQDGALVGFAVSFTRELMWLLATYAVRPDQQGRGVGKALLDAALQHGRGCLRGMLSASADPAAVRRYRLAGFSLHPQLVAAGSVDRAAIPVVERVRPAAVSDRAMMDSVDRTTRGAAHGDDHDLILGVGPGAGHTWVTDSATGSGYVHVGAPEAGGGVLALAATNRRTAVDLLWTALAEAPGEVTLAHLTPANEWALDVALAARLSVRTEGYLGLRGMRPPTPYLHHGALL